MEYDKNQNINADGLTDVSNDDILAELACLRNELENATSARRNFLANMSHEIRTPINAIKGLSELLALTKLSDAQNNYVQNIIISTNSLLGIVNDVLDFTKIDSDSAELIEGDYSMSTLVTEICSVMSARTAEKGLKLFVELSPSLPSLLKGDDVRIKQIMINLLGNAVKYTNEGYVLFRVYGENTRDGKIDIVCVIEDTGVGIKEEDISRLFLPFSRVDILSHRNISGTGLGLSISRKLANNMGGHISVESVYEKGSAFTVRFPQGISDPKPLASVDNPEAKNVLTLTESGRAENCLSDMLNEFNVKNENAQGRELGVLERVGYTHCIYDDSLPQDTLRHLQARMPDCIFIVIKDMRYAMEQSKNYDAVLFNPLLVTELAKALNKTPHKETIERNIDTFALSNTHVLIVDDNEINLLVAGEILKSYKADVTYANDGFEAIDICKDTKFDMIFMDHMMPGIDGIETTIEIRNGKGINSKTPIVALTANIAPEMREKYIACGMEDFIGKPLEISNLSCVLRRLLPKEKIVAMKDAIAPREDADKLDCSSSETMVRIIASFDAFGMYVSDVMREIENDYGLYLKRMEWVRYELNPLVKKMRRQVSDKKWDEFADDIGILANKIYDVGARDCAGRARNLNRAAKDNNADYILGDFFSLMDNMYMLQKKMEVAVPMIKGELDTNVPFGDRNYCLGLLRDTLTALENRNIDTVWALMESLSCYSLDHDLDMILLKIKAKTEKEDIAGASEAAAEALAYCEKTITG